ncbi:hypothetical protein K503DRAFT_784827 [Rhizopogon vinicolor AM-OR11-026]|uniref:Uncharacterized protein n=1 Tax=Rhizopogon vinicolor AM-OR11-026 TaxID=1314800 RepID=A0A1B7MT65_9AGAM|nr:hypothetical protein K503DRAFT_784827 [Rhizopogon vinicolor AM-OR11-026]
MPGGDVVKPGQAPWILIEGSYSGALTSWTMVNNIDAKPTRHFLGCIGIFCHRRGDHMLKEVFGPGDLGHVDDFAMAHTSCFYFGDALFFDFHLVDWQSLQLDVGPGAMFFRFCDALEVKDGINAGPGRWGLENAIYSWGNFWNTTYYNYRKARLSFIVKSVETRMPARSCIGTYDMSESYWTNTTVNNAVRSWTWMVCNQVGLYQDDPPYGQPAIVSRILDPIYHERQCINFFPEAFASPPQPTTAETNMMYAGWNVDVECLFFANGLRAPWRESTVSADGLYKPSTPSMPIYEGGGFYGSDMFTKSGIDDPTIAAVQEAALEYMAEWLAE